MWTASARSSRAWASPSTGTGRSTPPTPEYYKWTQWIFLQLYKHGLAYKKEMNVNWCTGCKCVLANEEVVNGVCERCGSEVVHRVKSQWMLKITDYADKLIDGLDGLDFIDRVVTQQKNWIGRSYGAEIDFGTTAGDKLTVYTTRCDTLFGATYMVLSPENAQLARWMEAGLLRNAGEVKAYQAEAARKSDFERTEINKEKTGVRLDGVQGHQPGQRAGDPHLHLGLRPGQLRHRRHHGGARPRQPRLGVCQKVGLPIVEVVKGKTPSDLDKEDFTDVATGTLVNSGFLDGLPVHDAQEKMIAWLEENGKGHRKVNYKLRDWVFSRQRYWGEPIPMVKCEKCGWQPLPESSLPLTLPDIVDFEPGPRRREPPGPPHRLGQDHLSLLRRPPPCGRPTPCLSGRARPGTSCGIWTPTTRTPSPPKRRWNTGPRWTGNNGGMEHTTPAPAVQPLLAQVPVRHRGGAHRRALPEAHLSRHDPGPEPPQLRQPARRGAEEAAGGVRQPEGRRKGPGGKVRRNGPPPGGQDVQEPGQRGQPGRRGGRLRRRHHAPV